MRIISESCTRICESFCLSSFIVGFLDLPSPPSPLRKLVDEVYKTQFLCNANTIFLGRRKKCKKTRRINSKEEPWEREEGNTSKNQRSLPKAQRISTGNEKKRSTTTSLYQDTTSNQLYHIQYCVLRAGSTRSQQDNNAGSPRHCTHQLFNPRYIKMFAENRLRSKYFSSQGVFRVYSHTPFIKKIWDPPCSAPFNFRVLCFKRFPVLICQAKLPEMSTRV